MIVEQLYTSCLAQAAYYIESNGEAAIIDPIRDIEPYLEKLNERKAKLKYIFETHFHADFVSGHQDLAKKTGAEIVYGPETVSNLPIRIATDGELFKVGDLNIQAIHTPGHTPESTCFLLIQADGKHHCLFTGDTLFVGDVGRPDLLDGKITKEELASRMFDSVQKLKSYANEILVYPGHGAGSACGKNIGKETFSTLGEQKASNYALKIESRKEFIASITAGIAPAPAYFSKDVELNRNGYKSYEDILKTGLTPLDVETLKTKIKNGATLIDSRLPDFFELGFVPGSINIGLNGQFAIWAATLLDLQSEIVLVCKPGTEKETVSRLARVGFDSISGYLENGFDAWKDAGLRYDMVISISAEELALDAKHNPKATILDVRKPEEFKSGHVFNAKNLPLNGLISGSENLDKNQEHLIHCAGGYRSMIAASMLKKNGFSNIKNVWGGFEKIKEEKVEILSN
ncbi:MAG: MBL fold metallo-hydrolase [Bacteroidetes bacterium]|nr:MBL fold metallo-hydrolase [Bacteroidota bacterium]